MSISQSILIIAKINGCAQNLSSPFLNVTMLLQRKISIHCYLPRLRNTSRQTQGRSTREKNALEPKNSNDDAHTVTRSVCVLALPCAHSSKGEGHHTHTHTIATGTKQKEREREEMSRPVKARMRKKIDRERERERWRETAFQSEKQLRNGKKNKKILFLNLRVCVCVLWKRRKKFWK